MKRNELQMRKRINLIHIIVKWPDKNEYILCNSIKFKKKKSQKRQDYKSVLLSRIEGVETERRYHDSFGVL